VTINETFVGYRLTTASRDRLLKLLPAHYDNVVADHITTDFLGGNRRTGFKPPHPKSVLVIGHAHDPQRQIHAAVISVDGHEHQGMDPDRRLHVTISHGKNARPVHSNDAIKNGWTRLDKPIPLQVIPMSAGVDDDVEGLVDRLVEGGAGRRLVLMRGLPGSGKSTRAKEIAGNHGKIFSTDDYFGDPYVFDGSKIAQAHQWNQDRTAKAMAAGHPLVVVDNTNIKREHMEPYLKLAKQHGYDVSYEHSKAPWAWDEHECARRNAHGVPLAAIKNMKHSFDESAVSDLVDRMIESRDVPHEIRQATPETQKKFADALKSGLSHRKQVKQRLSQYDEVIKGVSDHIGQPAYLVGGAVRDAFLGRENKDVDLVTVGGQKKLEDLGYKPIKGDFPVYTHPKFPGVEVALARGEKKVGEGHTGFAWHTAKSLDPDLKRRDLTVNAMAYHPSKGIIDPHGGQRDIADGYLRHIGKHFAEDPLRSFRVARFAAQTGMDVHPSTIAMMRTTKRELPTLSKDRVREEMAKSLKSKNPRQYFDTLHKAGILKSWHPEVAALKGKASTLPHHGDAYDHTMSALQHAAETGQSHDVRHLLLTQQMPEASIAKHGERFGMSKQEVSRLQTHASVHAVPFSGKGPADHSIEYWAKTQPNSLQPDHQAATTVNSVVSGTKGHTDHYQQVFDRLGGVKFSAADFQGKKGPEISQYKQRRWRDSLSGIAETVSQLVDRLIEGKR
jgi:tRNA nucleotidyltransferase/poly(A) polymerase/predicted kinase